MKERVDVIVVGFGTSGAVAAIAAARLGAKVLVLERSTYPGGTMTGGGVPGFYGRHPSGLTKRLFEAARMYSGLHGCSVVEALKAIMESEALASGCRLVYGAVPFDVAAEGKCVKGIRWAVDETVYEAEASIVIDCTGDASICRLAGCECTIGRTSDGLCNPYTFSVLCTRTDAPSNINVANFDAGRIDQNDISAFSRELLRGLSAHLKSDYSADAAESHEIAPADICGIREGAHLLTEDYLTLQDFFDGKLDDKRDVIAYAHSNIDTHANDMPLESTIFQDWMIAASMWGTEIWVPLTRGVLVPKGWKGLLVAGRHLGVDHDLGHAVRMNDHVGRTGEAAGVMAALAAKSATPQDVMALPFEEISTNMESMENPCSENDRFMRLSNEQILDGLSSDAPGFAIWAARCRKLNRELAEWYRTAPEGSNLKSNAAFALAILGDDCALPELLRLARTRDDYAPCTSRKYNHKRGYAAVYLLGRLRAVEAIPVLKGIISDLQMADNYEYHGHAIAALVRIAEAHPEFRKDVQEALLSLVRNPEWSIHARLKGTQQYVPVQGVFKDFVEKWSEGC